MQTDLSTPTVFQPNTIEYFTSPSADGGTNFFRRDVNNSNGYVNVTPITREQYSAAGYQDPTQAAPALTAVANTTQQTSTSNVTGGGTTTPTAPSPTDNLRSNIQTLISQAGDIYKQLYGSLEAGGASQRQQLESAYAKNLGTLGEQFTQELPKIGHAFAARGAYDSTWRTGAEENAQKAYGTQIGQVAQEQQAAIGKVGSAVATQKAQFGAGESALGNIAARLPQVTDINELTSLRNDIETKINELKVSQAGMGTQEQNAAQYASLAPASDKAAQIAQTIQTIIQGQAPTQLKKAIATQIVGSAGLQPEEEKNLLNTINSQLA